MKKRTSRISANACELGECQNDAEHETKLKTKQTMRNLRLCTHCLPVYLNTHADKDVWTKPLEKEGLRHELQEQAFH